MIIGPIAVALLSVPAEPATDMTPSSQGVADFFSRKIHLYMRALVSAPL